MDPVSLFLLVVAGIFLVGIAGEAAFARTGIPDVLWLLLVGVLLGPVTGLVPRDELTRIAPYFGAVTIVLVLFDGGLALRLEGLGRASGRAAALAVTGFVLAAAAVAAASMTAAACGALPVTWTWAHGATLGTILGGSSSVVVLPALRTARAPRPVANLLSLESALTDVLCIVATGVAVDVLVAEHAELGAAALSLARSLAVGIGVGGATGALAILALRSLGRADNAFPILIAALLVLYVAVEGLGGSAPLAILAAAVMVGNAKTLSEHAGLSRPAFVGRSLRSVQGQAAFTVRTFFFVFMGAMLGPPWDRVLLGAGIALCLLVARIPAVSLATVGMDLGRGSLTIARVSVPRGLAAGVLASEPSRAGVAEMADAPVVVYAAVATTVVLFAGGFALARRMRGPGDGPPDDDSREATHDAQDETSEASPDPHVLAVSARARRPAR